MTLEESWQSLLADLAEAARTVEARAVDDRERAEGYRHITRALALACEMLVEKGDPAHPEVTRWMTPHRKIMGDNPGTIYDAVMLDPAHRYRLRGRRGSEVYLGVALYGTGENGSRRVAGNIDDVALYGEDGSFDLHLAAERPDDLPDGATFLAMDPDVTDLLVRQYFHDPSALVGEAHEATYAVERVGAGAPPPPSPERVAADLARTGRWVRDLVEVESTLSAISALTAPPGIRRAGEEPSAEVDWDVVNRVQPSPAIGYAGAWFDDLADDEVVVVEGTLPPCRYASVQWLNRWMESGDHQHHQVVLTDRELEAGADGRFRVTLAHADPGDGPWLDATGVRHGTLVVRTVGAAESAPAEVEFRRERR